MTTHVASVDWSFADRPQATSPNTHGIARKVLVGPNRIARFFIGTVRLVAGHDFSLGWANGEPAVDENISP